MCSTPMLSAYVCICISASLSSSLMVVIMRSPMRSDMLFIMWWGRWQCSIQSPRYFASNSISRAWATPTSTVFSGPQRVSGWRPASVPVTKKVFPWRVMVHAEIHHPDAHAATMTHQQRRRVWAGLAVEGQPVELHIGGVGNVAVGQDGPLLQHDSEIVIYSWCPGFLGMDDE